MYKRQIVESALERYGSISFGGSEYECYAKGVIKLDLKDFNQDGTDELVMLYTPCLLYTSTVSILRGRLV